MNAALITTPIKCTSIVYRVFLSAIDLSNSGVNTSIGNISNLLINGAQASSTSISPNLISFDLTVPPGGTQPFTNFSIEFGVSGMPCPLSSGQGQLRYELKIVAICNDCIQSPSIPSNSIRNFFCLSTDVIVHCNGQCPSPIETYDDLVVERITFGWASPANYNNGLAPLPDAIAFTSFCNNQNIPNQPAVITQNQIYDQLGRLYPYDLFKLSVTGKIDPVNPYLHNNLSFEINYNPNPLVVIPPNTFLTIENYKLKFTSTNGAQFITIDGGNLQITPSVVSITNPPQPMTTPQDRMRLTWDVNGLNSLGVSINGASYYLDLEVTFRATATAPGGYFPFNLQCLFISETNNTNQPYSEYRSCDQRGRTITLIIPEVILRQNTKQTGNINLPANPPNSIVGIGNNPERFCDFVHAIGIRHSGGFGNLPDFFPEYRPLTKWPANLPGTNISNVPTNPVNGFPGSQNYTFNAGNYENTTSPVLLPTLVRGELNSSYQGLVLTMEKECPNSNPAVDLNLDINQNAYIHSGHYFGNWTPPNPLNPPQTNQPTPPLPGLNCNSVMILTGSATSSNFIPSGTPTTPFLYPFKITLPQEAEGLPISLEIIIGQGTTCPFQINPLLISNSGNPGNPVSPVNGNPNLYYFNLNGSSQLIPPNGLDVLLPIAMGCNCGPITIEFKLNVFCNSNNIGTQSPCLGCTQTRTFERSIGTLSNANISNAFSQSGCDLTWTLQLTNPATDPTLDLANLTLEVTTGMIIQGTPTISFSNGSSTGLIPPTFTLNSNVANTVSSTLSLQNFQLTPGGSVTYTINFHLTEDLCSLVPLNNLLSASFSGDNVCNEPLGPIPININTATPNLANLLTGLVANPTCCEQDPTITVNHVCSATATNGSILVTNPNLGGTLPIVATLYNPFPCVTPACSTMVVSSISQPNPTFVGLGIGTYYLTIWDPNNGGYYTQTVLIEDHSFTLTIEPTTPPAFCDPGNVLLTAIPTPNTPPLSSFNFTYAWYSNNIPILNANGSTYLANSAGSYTVIVTDGGNCTASATTNVVVNPPLSINGPPTACDINAQYYLPAIIPTNGTFQYTWKINNVLHQITSNNFTTIDWSTYGYFGGLITVSIPDGACGEKQILTFNVQPCCDSPNMPKLYVDNLSDIMLNTPLIANVALTAANEYTISNATFELENLTNQFLLCDANLILDNCNIAMNDANSFKMSNGKNITLINTNIKGCLTRHNGIDATAGNNFVRIDNSTNQSGIIQDANTAITISRGNLTSINGGFDKNIEHIYAEKSTVNIIGGYYNCSTNLLPPYNPLLLPPNNSISFTPTATSIPHWGIRLFNCNPNSIYNGGGALPVIKEVIIINANTGIEVRGGGLICKGNYISNCTRGIYHWNTINSSQNADAECNIGTWNGTTSDANQFTNCAESIFAGGKLIPCHIDGNYIFNAIDGFGIKLQWLKGRGFSIYNNTLENCRTGIYSYGNACNESNQGNTGAKLIRDNTLTHDPGNPLLTKAIVVEEPTVTANDPALYLHVSENWVEGYRHGITATNSAFLQVFDNRVYLSPDLAGIWDTLGNLTDYINGIGVNYCPKAVIKNNKVSAKETTPYSWATWLTSGFRIDMSPGTTVCSNTASESTHPITGDPLQIGDPFEFHGNCAPTTFKLNTMNNSTARGLYMGGINNGQGSNGVVIGDQGTFGIPHDNFWNPLAGFHTDYNNVEGNLNTFYLNTCLPTGAAFHNGQGGPVFPFNTFQCNTTNGTVSCGGLPFFVDSTHDVREIDVYDDIARDSTSNLGGNDTTRYFGKEFLYSQIKGDSTLLNYQALSTFQDSVELSNAKHIDALKQGLIFPIDSLAKDSLLNKVSMIQPANNIENYYQEVFELALQNPELKDSVYLPTEMERLREIARLCPFVEGSAVYTARVILHAFEPDTTYYNYCEFAKPPDRTSSERMAQNESELFKKQALEFASGLFDFKLVPNPNDGRFILHCTTNNALDIRILDNVGREVHRILGVPAENQLHFNLEGMAKGIYLMSIRDANGLKTIRFSIQ